MRGRSRNGVFRSATCAGASAASRRIAYDERAMSEKILRRLKVLADSAEREALPTRKFFHIGNAEVKDEPHQERCAGD